MVGLGCASTSHRSNRFSLWKDVYDIERFEEVRQIAAEMLVEPSGQPLEVVKELFCNESGYQTPKLDTRAAIFQDNKILLVQENDGLWSLPGGWCDVDQSVKDNVIKEVKEEAGTLAKIDSLELLEKKRKRQEVGRARSRQDLEDIALRRGYKFGWVRKMMEIKGIRQSV